MRLNDGQSFLDLYYKPETVEIATGIDQASLFHGRGQDVRNSGQVSTPDDVADAMAAWVMGCNPTKVMDPAAGFGHLLHACHRINPDCKKVGIESEQDVFQAALSVAPKGTKLVLSDYLYANTGLFEGIIANPPYVKSQRLGLSEPQWCYFDELFGTKLGRQTNLYALFILKIWEDLAPGGRAAMIVPAEFLNANFGVAIKEAILKMMPRGLAVFAPDVNLFAKTLTTSTVLFLEKKKAASPTFRGICISTVSQLSDFVRNLEHDSKGSPDEIDLSALPASGKWLNLLFNQTEGRKVGTPQASRIGDFFRCSRGIATGANDYFCLRLSEIESSGLSPDDFDACVTKAADITGWLFGESCFRQMAASDKRCFLLNPKTINPAMKAYLEHGIAIDVDQRHLPSKRPLWYLPERVNAPQILVPVFTRKQPRFILNTARVKNLTCFHGMYAKPGYENLLPLVWVYLNSTEGLRSFQDVNRFYGNGLNKLEPKDVEQMACPDFRSYSVAAGDIQKRISEHIGDYSVAKFDQLLRDALSGTKQLS